MFAVPSNDTPAIVLAEASAVAVAERPLQAAAVDALVTVIPAMYVLRAVPLTV